MATMKTMATVYGYENECDELQHHKTKKNWNDTYNMQLTKHNTNDDVDARELPRSRWRTCTEPARIVHSLCWWYTSHTHGSSSERIHTPSMVIHMAHSPWLASPLSTSTFSSCLSPSSSSTSSCSLSSTTRRSWQTCAAPLQKRVRTPWTSSPLPQFMSPTSWPSASSTTHQLPFSFMIPSTDQDVVWRDTRRDSHSGKPRTSRLLCTRRHVSQSVVVVCNVRWIRATWWAKQLERTD